MAPDQRKAFAIAAALLEHRYFLPCVILLGVLFRTCLLIATRHNAVFADELDYQSIGLSVWQKHEFSIGGWPTAFRPPGQPVLIAALYALFGEHPLAVKAVEVLLLAPLPLLCALLARTLGFGTRAANLGALFAAFHPGLAYAATTLYPTVLTAAALTLGIVWSAVAERSGRISVAMAGGLSLGVAACATSTFVPLPILVSIYCLFKRKFRVALLIGVFGMLPTVLWVTRNRAVMGEWTLATNGGVNLYIGANSRATPLSENWVPATFAAGKDEVAEDRAYSQRAKLWIHDHPARYTMVSIGRAFMVADSVGNPKTKGMHSGVAARVIGWCMFPVTILGIVGLILYRRTAAAWFTFAALLLVVASSALTLVKPRFRFPCDPLLGTFAAAAIYSAPKYFRRRVRDDTHAESSN